MKSIDDLKCIVVRQTKEKVFYFRFRHVRRWLKDVWTLSKAKSALDLLLCIAYFAQICRSYWTHFFFFENA